MPDQHIPLKAEPRVDREYLWNFGVGLFMYVMYFVNPENPDRIVWLFAAAFCVIHGVGNKVISHVKAELEAHR